MNHSYMSTSTSDSLFSDATSLQSSSLISLPGTNSQQNQQFDQHQSSLPPPPPRHPQLGQPPPLIITPNQQRQQQQRSSDQSSTLGHPFHFEEFVEPLNMPRHDQNEFDDLQNTQQQQDHQSQQIQSPLPIENNNDNYSLNQRYYQQMQQLPNTSQDQNQRIEALSDQDRQAAEHLPTYDELAESEPVRFRRWRRWIDKRAIETREIRNQHGQRRTGWDLSSPSQKYNNQTSRTASNASTLLSHNEEQNYFSRLRVINEDQSLDRNSSLYTTPPVNLSASAHPSSSAVPLTISSSNHPIGPRHLPFPFESEPLCAAFLPQPLIIRNSKKAKAPAWSPELPAHRYSLVGTLEGLWVIDFAPDSTKNDPKSSRTVENAKLYQIWSGQAVHQISICDDGDEHDQLRDVRGHVPRQQNDTPRSYSRSHKPKPGVVIMLVSNEDNFKSVRLWSVQAILNLVKWRTLTESSRVLDLGIQDKTKQNQRKSALSGFKRFFGDQPSASSSSSSSAAPTSSSSPTKKDSYAGDYRSETESRASISSSRDALSMYSSVNGGGGGGGHPADFESGPSNSSPPPQPEEKEKPAIDPTIEQPMEWATKSATINLHNNHSPVLFFELSFMYNRNCSGNKNTFQNQSSPNLFSGTGSSSFSMSSDSISDDFSNESHPQQQQPQSHSHNKQAKSQLSGSPFLIIATKSSVYVFQQYANAFQFVSEYYVPVAPKFVKLLQGVPVSKTGNGGSDQSSNASLNGGVAAGSHSSTATKRAAHRSSYGGPYGHSPANFSSTSSLYGGQLQGSNNQNNQLALFVGLRGKKRGVLISLADASVVEVTIPTQSPSSNSVVTSSSAMNNNQRHTTANMKEFASGLVKSIAGSSSSSSLTNAGVESSALALSNKSSASGGHHKFFGMLNDGSEAHITGLIELEIPIPQDVIKNRFSHLSPHNYQQQKQLQLPQSVSVLFITRGSTTHVYSSNFGLSSSSPSSLATPSSSNHHHHSPSSSSSIPAPKQQHPRDRSSSLGEERRRSSSGSGFSNLISSEMTGMKPEPIFTFEWVCTPQRVVALCPPPTKPANNSNSSNSNNNPQPPELTLVLVAFAENGLEVKEGVLNPSVLLDESLAPQPVVQSRHSLSTPTATPTTDSFAPPFFILKDSVVKEEYKKGKQAQNINDDDYELYGTAFLEMGSQVDYLCSETAQWDKFPIMTSRTSRPSGSLWWTRHLNEYKMMWIACARLEDSL